VLFNSFIFLFGFLPIVLLVFARLRTKRSQLFFLLLASYVFYGSWDYRFLPLLLFSTTVDFLAGRLIAASATPAKRKAWLAATISLQLLLLGFFKYFNFFVSAVSDLLARMNWPIEARTLNIVLPVGISFYTFQSMSYTIDVYRGQVGATRSFVKFAAYVALFPQLVAGPIVRYSELDRELDELPKRVRLDSLSIGTQIFLFGLFKKVLVADTLAGFLNPLLARYTELTAADAWMAVLGYTFQLYFDFSGYSDMALGLGTMLGFRFPRNFHNPYQALNPQDFWRRWHITLSRWLRDYLYLPLGGNRKGPRRTIVNLLIVFGLGGLWHGAAWTFIVWGLYHFVIVAGYHIFHRQWDAWPRVVQRVVTFLLVVGSWVIFRSTDLTMATGLLSRMLDAGAGLWFSSGEVTTLAAMNAVLLVAVNLVNRLDEFEGGISLTGGVVFAVLFVVTILRINATAVEFLYYQF
jgi:alginate O-acetyltransferase complex protein AlgI